MPDPTPADDRPLKERDLTALATHFGTDKWGVHRYTPHYERHLQHLRDAYALPVVPARNHPLDLGAGDAQALGKLLRRQRERDVIR